jgi:hypothetical protein
MFRIPWQQTSDAQYIAQLRQTLARWDRGRPWLLAVYVAILGILVLAVSKGVDLLVGLAKPAQAPWPLFGFVVGALFGFLVAWLFHFLVFGLGRMLMGFRAERLLVRYYDAIASEAFPGADQP